MLFQVKPTPKPMERRRFARVKLVLAGRYMLEDRREFLCQTIDVSAGGLSLTAPEPGAIGEKIVAYFDDLGRIEGIVVRHHAFGFAISACMSATKREKLVNQLTWLANRQYLALPADRRHERITPNEPRTLIRLPDGEQIPAKIVDISISGAAVTCAKQAPMGAMLQIGHTSARVVRADGKGMGLEFARLLSFDIFDENIRL